MVVACIFCCWREPRSRQQGVPHRRKEASAHPTQDAEQSIDAGLANPSTHLLNSTSAPSASFTSSRRTERRMLACGEGG